MCCSRATRSTRSAPNWKGLTQPATLELPPRCPIRTGTCSTAQSFSPSRCAGAYEAVTGLQGYSNENYVEYGVEASINFPVSSSRSYLRKSASAHKPPRKSVSSSTRRNVPSSDAGPLPSRGVTAGPTNANGNHRVDVLDLNYVYMPWILHLQGRISRQPGKLELHPALQL